jgi:hypothetical protein
LPGKDPKSLRARQFCEGAGEEARVPWQQWSVPIGSACLVPADVSPSIWFFCLFGRLELQTAPWLGWPAHYGGTWGEPMK